MGPRCPCQGSWGRGRPYPGACGEWPSTPGFWTSGLQNMQTKFLSFLSHSWWLFVTGGAFKNEKVPYLECGLQQGPWRGAVGGNGVPWEALAEVVPGISGPCSIAWRDLIFRMLGEAFFFSFNVHWPFLLCGLLIAYHILFKVFIFIYVWLHQDLDVACRIFSCGTWNLVPQPGIEPRPPASGAQRLSHWATRDIPEGFYSECLLEAFLLFSPEYSLYEFLFLKHFHNSFPCIQLQKHLVFVIHCRITKHPMPGSSEW